MNRINCNRPHSAETSGSTPRNNQPEAASHHRLRPKRAIARTLLRVAAGKPTAADKQKLAEAAVALKSHHGSAPPSSTMGRDVKKVELWECRGTKFHPCGHWVPKGMHECKACGNQPPEHVWAKAKGSRKWGKGKGASGGAKGSQKGAAGSQGFEVAMRREMQALQKKNDLLQKQVASYEAGESKANHEACQRQQNGEKPQDLAQMQKNVEFMEKNGVCEEALKLERARLATARAERDAARPEWCKIREAQSKAGKLEKNLGRKTKELEEAKAACAALESEVKDLESNLAQARSDVQDLAKKHGEVHSAELGYTDAADAAVEQVKKLKEVLPPALAHGFTPAMEQVMEFFSSISADAQRWAQEYPPVGHRPAGTEEACAGLVDEGRAARHAAKFAANFVPTQVSNMYDLLYEEMAVDSDDESVAPSEGGEDGRLEGEERDSQEQSHCKNLQNQGLTVGRMLAGSQLGAGLGVIVGACCGYGGSSFGVASES